MKKKNNIWLFAKQTKTANAYINYLVNFPNGIKIDSAKLLIDEYYWSQAIMDSTLNGYENYLKKSQELDTIYKYKAEKVIFAHDSIEKINTRNGREERLDEEAWIKADSLKTFDGYLEYIMGNYNNKYNINQAIYEIRKRT